MMQAPAILSSGPQYGYGFGSGGPRRGGFRGRGRGRGGGFRQQGPRRDGNRAAVIINYPRYLTDSGLMTDNQVFSLQQVQDGFKLVVEFKRSGVSVATSIGGNLNPSTDVQNSDGGFASFIAYLNQMRSGVTFAYDATSKKISMVAKSGRKLYFKLVRSKDQRTLVPTADISDATVFKHVGILETVSEYHEKLELLRATFAEYFSSQYDIGLDGDVDDSYDVYQDANDEYVAVSAKPKTPARSRPVRPEPTKEVPKAQMVEEKRDTQVTVVTTIEVDDKQAKYIAEAGRAYLREIKPMTTHVKIETPTSTTTRAVRSSRRIDIDNMSSNVEVTAGLTAFGLSTAAFAYEVVL